MSSAGSAPPIDGKHNIASAYSGGKLPLVELQVSHRFDKRSCITASGVPRARVQQVMTVVLQLRPYVDKVPPDRLRLDVHRDDEGRYRHPYGLALAVAMISTLSHKIVPAAHVFVGDLDLRGHLRDVSPKLVDDLNDAIADFRIAAPVTVVLAPDSAAWVQSSSTVRVKAARTLAEAVLATWPDEQVWEVCG
jgi:predicted ATP-dependent serine protease